MKICLRCGCQTVDEVNFCPICGQAISPSQEAAPSPYYPTPPEKPKPPALAKSIVSMVLSIGALECAAAGTFFVTFITFMFGMILNFSMSNVVYDPELQFTKAFFSLYIAMIAIILGGFALAMGLVGRHLGNSAKSIGNQTKMAHFGVKLGKISVILSIVIFALAAVSAALLWLM